MSAKVNAGAKILDGLRDALSGNFASVTIEGQRWVRAPEWQPIVTAPKSSTSTILIAGQYSNGLPYVEVSYWDPRGHWSGRRLEPPTHWQPLPSPPVKS